MSGRYSTFPDYKASGSTWLGDIPEAWSVGSLRWYIDIASGDGLSNKHIHSTVDDINQFRVIGGNGTLGFSAFSNTSDRAFAIGRVGALCGNVHYLDDECWVTDNALRMSIWREYNDSYLYFLLTAAKLNEYANKSAQPLITGEVVKGLAVVIPPLLTQQKIANFLDHETAKIDTLIEKQQQLIKLLKEKRQAVISHAVTKGLNPDAPMRDSGVEWLGEVPVGWLCCGLKRHAFVIDCKHITAEFVDRGYPLASIGQVKGKTVDLTNAKQTNGKCYQELIDGGRRPLEGDIIYSRNATVGEAAIVASDMPQFAMGQDVCLIRFSDQLVPEFALYVLKSSVISQQLELAMVGSTFKRINVDDIRNYLIALPSIDEQKVIVRSLDRSISKYEDVILRADAAIELMKERRTALISAAVTGKIDVRNWQPTTSTKAQPNKEATP